MRRARQGSGIHREDEADPGGREIDLAKRCDFGGDVAAKDVDGDRIADLEAQFQRLFGGKADLGRACIILGPPIAVGDLGALGRAVGIGDAPVALQHPMAAAGFCSRSAIDLGDDPPQHGCAFRWMLHGWRWHPSAHGKSSICPGWMSTMKKDGARVRQVPLAMAFLRLASI